MKSKVSEVQKMLNVWAVVLILWAVYRSYFGVNLPVWFDEFFAKPLIFLVPLFYYITVREKSTFLRSVDLVKKDLWKNVLFGTLIGGIFMGTGIVVQYTKTNSFDFLLSKPILSILYFSLIAIASSFSEEILSRGFVLKRLYADSKNALSSVFYASILFFFLHIPILFTNPNMYGTVLLQVMATDILLSFAVSLLYLQRKNLIVPIIIHACYSLSIYLFIS